MTESQLQILALAEEVERLQVVVSDERAARDAIRRRFLKLSSPAATAAGQQRAAEGVHSTEASPVKGGTERSGSEEVADAAAQVASPTRESVVDRVQRAAHQRPDHSAQTGAHRAKQPRRGFSLWSFITGADRVADEDDDCV